MVSIMQGGISIEREKGTRPAREAVDLRMDLADAGHYPDRDHEFLPNGSRVYHVVKNGLQCQHGLE